MCHACAARSGGTRIGRVTFPRRPAWKAWSTVQILLLDSGSLASEYRNVSDIMCDGER